jgi:hypothetical protein
MIASALPSVLVIFGVFAFMVPGTVVAALPVIYEARGADAGPISQGWTAEEVAAGSDGNADGLIDAPGNTGPVAGEGEGGIAWQIHDIRTEAGLNVPGYTHTVSAADRAELLAKGWVFSTRIKVARHGSGAAWDAFVSWGITNFQGADRRVGFAVGATGNAFFAKEDTGGATVTLAANTLKDYHTITAYGAPGSSVYQWYLDGSLAGTRDLMDNTVAQGDIVRFFSGSSPLINAASNWSSVTLKTWAPEDVTVFRPNGSAVTFARWVPPPGAFTYVFTPLASSGNIAFTSPPVVDAAGALKFTPASGSTGTAAFDLLTPHGTMRFHITADNLAAGFPPQHALDFTASQFLTSSLKTARIRAWRQPPGARKGIVLILTGFNPNLPTFGTPAEDKAGVNLAGYAKVPYTEGWDVWEFHWHDPRTNIEDNAMIVQEVLRALAGGGFNLDPGGTNFMESLSAADKLVVAGGSMGGLVGRFALCYLDHHSHPYRCDSFLSVDSPQQGANIPVGLQQMAIYANALPESYRSDVDATLLATVINSFDSPAARQMLVLHHSRANEAGVSFAPERQTFLNLLNSFGNWPAHPGMRMAAIANGRGDGKLQDGDAGRPVFTLPKPGADPHLAIDYTSDIQVVADTTTDVPAVTCFLGTLRVRVTINLRMQSWAPNPLANPGSSMTFRGDPSVIVQVWGTEEDIFGEPTGVEHTGSTVLDTSGGSAAVTVRLREWIKANGTPNGPTCGIILDDRLDTAIGGYIGRLTGAQTLEQTHRASSTSHWDYVPGAWRNTGQFAAASLRASGTVADVKSYHTFIPTVSALGLSGSVAPHSAAIPPNAAASSPFDALYHFGAFANTGHLEDYDEWLSDILAHELRIVTGEFTADTSRLPHSIGWRGLYLLEETPDLAAPWTPRLFARHGVYATPQPIPARSFFRLSFPQVFR